MKLVELKNRANTDIALILDNILEGNIEINWQDFSKDLFEGMDGFDIDSVNSMKIEDKKLIINDISYDLKGKNITKFRKNFINYIKSLSTKKEISFDEYNKALLLNWLRLDFKPYILENLENMEYDKKNFVSNSIGNIIKLLDDLETLSTILMFNTKKIYDNKKKRIKLRKSFYTKKELSEFLKDYNEQKQKELNFEIDKLVEKNEEIKLFIPILIFKKLFNCELKEKITNKEANSIISKIDAFYYEDNEEVLSLLSELIYRLSMKIKSMDVESKEDTMYNFVSFLELALNTNMTRKKFTSFYIKAFSEYIIELAESILFSI
ncbi:hypothetical protein [Oceanivirga miroungae]|uniref:Uncharacterized protein n=1 Tax=Oceanivirga miroungae TaxID=1130046 RepID=A0A6I8ME53_9FUSO|nr:hypothetical protein [Oceanivirga miroungae]VWL85381.1 hypothetical protein OMES3154_00666 [Oceanivirga miroungae]